MMQEHLNLEMKVQLKTDTDERIRSPCTKYGWQRRSRAYRGIIVKQAQHRRPYMYVLLQKRNQDSDYKVGTREGFFNLIRYILDKYLEVPTKMYICLSENACDISRIAGGCRDE